jgi:hypothetical protein
MAGTTPDHSLDSNRFSVPVINSPALTLNAREIFRIKAKVGIRSPRSTLPM